MPKGWRPTYQVFSAPYGQLDGQVGYDFNKHVGVFLSFQNLTNSAQHTYLQWSEPAVHVRRERTALLPGNQG